MDLMTLFVQLMEDKELRKTLRQVLEIVDKYEDARKDANEVRELANKLHKENNRLLQHKKSLEMDKKALTQFILDEVEDEKTLAKIFNF